MKAVFISDVSPSKGHIYGLRVSSFARAFARRGHRVVLLSPTSAPADAPVPSHELPRLLHAHDWVSPLHVTAQPQSAPLVGLVRSGKAPILRNLVTGYLLLVQGGVHSDWERGARPLAAALACNFGPDVVWAVFGNASTLVVGQRLARACRAAWIMDIKDNWESYTPPAARASIRRRFADASGYTSNAHVHGDIAARWLAHDKSIVYSGVASEMVAAPDCRADRDVFQLTLVGSTYSEARVAGFLQALARWHASVSPSWQTLVKLRYAGSSAEAVKRAVNVLAPTFSVEVTGNIPHTELAKLCQSAAANCYLWAPYTFHHKMLELLATRRPAISFPGEHEESIRLAREIGGELMACRSENELIAAFDKVWQRWRSGDLKGASVDPSAFSWDAGAAKLEDIFAKAVASQNQRSASAATVA